MKLIIKYIILLSLLVCFFSEVTAQSENNFQKLQEISIKNQIKKKREITKKKESKQDTNDSILSIFDIDIDLTLGTITFDLSWGDPVENPQIRCNKASNLYGPVRHDVDGSIRWHRGFDYYAPHGTPVRSVGKGVVSLIQTHPDYGLCILVTHKRPSKTYYSFYAHLSLVSVRYGELVQQGTMLGKSGTTGNAYNLTGEEEHLHFEYRTNPKHGAKQQANPNTIVKTKFYSADPKNKWQSKVGVIKKGTFNIF
ncbi:M23 family metallopeptidase [Parabacteroides pacaensis]|uniref:M23 family metallopeptidase n=1 Tax=Parabacteroides pacaensis TaxID=2086575 RepID=UPI000D0FD612|nr:M23 family metallopeptidase [Parabacteroides pacaensis]